MKVCAILWGVLAALDICLGVLTGNTSFFGSAAICAVGAVLAASAPP